MLDISIGRRPDTFDVLTIKLCLPRRFCEAFLTDLCGYLVRQLLGLRVENPLSELFPILRGDLDEVDSISHLRIFGDHHPFDAKLLRSYKKYDFNPGAHLECKHRLDVATRKTDLIGRGAHRRHVRA
jgi:hypothetical protein